MYSASFWEYLAWSRDYPDINVFLVFAYSHNYEYEKGLTHYLHPITVQGLMDGKKTKTNEQKQLLQKKFRLPLCASVSIWWVFEECVQG